MSIEAKMPLTRVSEIIKGKRRVTADTALRLSKFFGTTPDFWLGLQMEYDLREEKFTKAKEISSIKSLKSFGTVWKRIYQIMIFPYSPVLGIPVQFK